MKLTAAITLREESTTDEDAGRDKISFNILLDPTDKDDKVKVSIFKFGSGTAEDWIKFLLQAQKVAEAKEWSNKPQQLHAMYRLLFKGEAEALYIRLTGGQSVTTPTVVIIKEAIDKMTRQYLPIDCAKNTVRYLQQVRKPYEMSVESFYTRIKTIDSYLNHMPPPMNNSLGMEQLRAIVENSVPSEWARSLHERETLGQQTDMATMIQYFKVLEVNERGKPKDSNKKSITPSRNPKSTRSYHAASQKNHNSTQGSSDEEQVHKGSGTKVGSADSGRRTSSRTNPTGKWCSIHKSSSHTTEECRLNPNNQSSSKQESHAINTESEQKLIPRRRVFKNKEESHKLIENDSEKESSEDECFAIKTLIPKCDLRMIIKGPKRAITCKVLLDTGSSKTILDGVSLLEAAGLKAIETDPIQFTTMDGTFTTSKQVSLQAYFPQFSKHRLLEFDAQVDERRMIASEYDLIIGRDFLSKFKIKLDFSSEIPIIQWDDLFIEMSYKIESVAEPIIKIHSVVNNLSHLTTKQKQLLHDHLKEYFSLFDGTLGRAMKAPPITIQLSEGAPSSIHCRPIPVPQSKIALVKKEIEELVKAEVLESCDPAPWAFPTFAVPKKDGSIRIVTDFRRLNEVIKRVPFPMPTLSQLIHKLHGFTFVSAIDLYKGYYHFLLDEQAKKLCTTILPWGYYRYKRLPMGISIAADIFQHQTSSLFLDLEYVLGSFEDHLQKLSNV